MNDCKSTTTSIPKQDSSPLPVYCSHTIFSKKSTASSNVNAGQQQFESFKQQNYTIVEKTPSHKHSQFSISIIFKPMTSKKHSTSSPYFCKLFSTLQCVNSIKRQLNETSTIQHLSNSQKSISEISSSGKLTSSQLKERMKKAFSYDEPNHSTISNAFQNVPHPTPVTLSNTTRTKLEKENIVYSTYSHPSTAVDYSFKLPNSLPAHRKEFCNGNETIVGYCCLVCSMLAKSIMYSHQDKFQLFQEGKEIGPEELNRIVSMYGKEYSSLLGGRMCDRHYQQICLSPNVIRNNSSFPRNNPPIPSNLNQQEISPRSRPIRTVSSVYATKRFSSHVDNIKHSPGKKTKYSDALSSDEYDMTTSSSSSDDSQSEEESTPLKRRTSTRLQQRKDLTLTFKLLIQEEKSDMENSLVTLNDGDRSINNVNSNSLKEETHQLEVSNTKKRRFFKRRNSNSIASSKIYSRTIDVQNVSIVVLPQQLDNNTITSNDLSMSASQINNDIDSNGSTNSHHSNDFDMGQSSSLPMIRCASPEEQKRLYFMDFIEYDEECEQVSNQVEEEMMQKDTEYVNEQNGMNLSSSILGEETKNLSYLVKLMEELVNHDDEDEMINENEQQRRKRRIIRRK